MNSFHCCHYQFQDSIKQDGRDAPKQEWNKSSRLVDLLPYRRDGKRHVKDFMPIGQPSASPGASARELEMQKHLSQYQKEISQKIHQEKSKMPSEMPSEMDFSTCMTTLSKPTWIKTLFHMQTGMTMKRT